MRLKPPLLSAVSFAAMWSGAAHPQGAVAPVAAPAAMEEIVVTADPLRRSREEVVSSVAVLRGDSLVQRRQGTLGDMLAGLPGVNSDTFGGGASRPVIRGQSAPRVKVLVDGVGVIDASEVSPDHAVSGEPLLLEGVEILRGPSALLYGGGAIGGAVNMIDTKIPTALPENGVSAVAEFRFGSADDERAGIVGVTLGAGSFALRLEGAARESGDYEVPGWGEDRVDGSFSRARTASAGLSWIGENGYLGLAYTEQRSDYGLPGHSHDYESCHPHGSSLHCGGHGDEDAHDHDHGHDHAHEDVPVVDLLSRRIDLRGAWRNPFDGVERIRIRGGYADYAHDEIDDDEVMTTFRNEGYDGRFELQHAPIWGLRGVVGAEIARNDFAALGEEAFIPESRTRAYALFLIEEYAWGDWRVEGAVRQEWQDKEAARRPDVAHAPFSASAAVSWSFMPGVAASVSVSRSQRAPSVQELYARGAHLATNTFELGDAMLGLETAHAVEFNIRKTAGATTFSAGLYRYDYDGYIYARTLDQHEDFRLIRYAQSDARFTGLEGEIRHAFSPHLALGAFGDHVRADLRHGGDLPRIPAGRLGVRAEVEIGQWSGDLEYVRVFEQTRIAAFETETPGYDMVNATIAYDVALPGADAQIYLRGTNLLDELAFNHASFIKDLAPLKGRNIVVGLRARF